MTNLACLSEEIEHLQDMSLVEARKHIERIFWKWASERIILETRDEIPTQSQLVQGADVLRIIHRGCSKVMRMIEAWQNRESLKAEKYFACEITLERLLQEQSPYHKDFKDFYEIVNAGEKPTIG